MFSSSRLVSTLSRERETIDPGCSPRPTIAMDSKRVAVRGKRSGPTDPKVRPETPLWQVYGASIRQEREKSPLAGHMEAMSSSVALHSGSLPHNAPRGRSWPPVPVPRVSRSRDGTGT